MLPYYSYYLPILEGSLLFLLVLIIQILHNTDFNNNNTDFTCIYIYIHIYIYIFCQPVTICCFVYSVSHR